MSLNTDQLFSSTGPRRALINPVTTHSFPYVLSAWSPLSCYLLFPNGCRGGCGAVLLWFWSAVCDADGRGFGRLVSPPNLLRETGFLPVQVFVLWMHLEEYIFPPPPSPHSLSHPRVPFQPTRFQFPSHYHVHIPSLNPHTLSPSHSISFPLSLRFLLAPSPLQIDLLLLIPPSPARFFSLLPIEPSSPFYSSRTRWEQ